VRDKDGEVVAAVVALTDITAQKRRDERLTYLAGLLDNTEDGIIALDAQWFITVWNAAAERLYGWTADEVMGRHTLDVARLEMSHEQRTEVRVAVAERGRWRGEVMAYRKDGTPVWVELITVALHGPDGEITGYLGIHRDIGERKRADEALRQSQRRTETILESISDAFVAMDRDWRYTYVNDRALRRLAEWRGRPVTREEVIGRSVRELFPDAAGTEAEDRVRAAMDAREPVEFELYFAPTDEWVEARAYPSASGLSIFYRSISARKRAEQALEGVREAERSRIARDLHDGALQGLTHALAVTGRRAPGRDDDVQTILAQVGRQLRAAVYDLRREQGAELPFADALRDLVELNREMVPGCDVTLETGDDLPRESFGRRGSDVLRIVGEAVANACRHAAADRVVVRVTGPATRLSVEVIDDGRGFDPDRRAPGTDGQGLRGMRERAENLGANLEVRSGQAGTTVRLEVDLSR
jgi:PAS domain S-box-containing protein